MKLVDWKTNYLQRGETNLESEMRVAVFSPGPIPGEVAESGQPWLKVDEESMYQRELS